ncbi:ribosomal protein S6 kinase delta-1 isoform X2 [Haematobia irritans]|uniref:ribosomal protein S6 kinase delta-1 isoform X2 n=1 Tax=Haematobia irritans TaxID=7368 RepID=UPI003F50D3FE
MAGGWIHNFTVTDTDQSSGYTLYKITSIVFPRSKPQALTQLVLWRRFHDIKKLHRELKRRHKNLCLPGYLPEPIDCSFFKRFDRDVIEKRKVYILSLLDFAAQHPQLYKSHSFAQFFHETTPPNKIQKLVGKAARFGRNLQIEQCDQIDNQKLKCNTLFDSSDNDGVALFEENEVVEEENDKLPDDSNTFITLKNNLRFLTPMASVEIEDNDDYIYEAAIIFTKAVQAEVNLEYNEAYLQYKNGVDLLLKGSKEDQNDDRVYIARAKIAKYLARAEDIYDRFLKISHRSIAATVSTSNFQLAIDVSGNTNSDTSGLYLERPWNHMAKYKVKSLLHNKVLLVSSNNNSYVMKGIEKPSSNSATQTVFLPQHVPYMVDLLAFFQSDQKIFLLLQLALGGKLLDKIHSPPKSSDELKDQQATITISKPLTSNEFEDLVDSSKQLIESVSNTLKESMCGTSETILKKWSRQLLVVIHALHEKSVMLCDLHMDNLLLDENGQLLLTYFYQNEGVSSDGCIHKALSPKAMENHFVAPERPLTLRSDWWSYGVVLYELFIGLRKEFYKNMSRYTRFSL